MWAVATPKQIRELMKVDGLTNDEVKSHLQVGTNTIALFLLFDFLQFFLLTIFNSRLRCYFQKQFCRTLYTILVIEEKKILIQILFIFQQKLLSRIQRPQDEK